VPKAEDLGVATDKTGSQEEGKPLVELGTAYTSLRNSGYDFEAAAGEIVDNALQAEASSIDVIVHTEAASSGRQVISSVAFVDDGVGMDLLTAHGCLSLGFSTRYNDRQGIGRFGVGATLAAISQCKRITLWTRTDPTAEFISTYIDLDEIESGIQTMIAEPKPAPPVEHLADLLKGKSGTVILWEKCDRLQQDPNGREQLAESQVRSLRLWMSRTYRYYLYDGRAIRVNGQLLTPHDPLFLRPEDGAFPEDPKAEEVLDESFDWPIPGSDDRTSKIRIRMTLLPKELRPEQGAGGKEPARIRQINSEQEGVSVLRHKREVAFGNFYPMTPAAEERDRWWGCEILFEPELDECWMVKNVKRGARPIKELEDRIGGIIKPKITKLRSTIREDWRRQDIAKEETEGVHAIAEEIVKAVEAAMKPTTQAGIDISDELAADKKTELIEDPDLVEPERETLKQKLEKKALPISVQTKAMTGSEFIETDYLGKDQMVITFNKNHPFFDMYNGFKELEASTDPAAAAMATQVRHAVDLLLMAYGRAESMMDLSNSLLNDAFTDLRTFWGVHLRKYINELKRR
jgi:hypothetical protein